MKSDQTSIYFMEGGSKEEIQSSKFVTQAVKRGVEVIYEIITEPIVPGIGGDLNVFFGQSYDGKPFVSVAKEGLVLPDDEEHQRIFESEKNDYYQLCNFIKCSLKEKIDKVVLVDYLVTSPCCIEVKQCGWSTLTDGDMKMTKQLEINPDHKIIKKLKEMVDEGQQGDLAKQMIMLLFDSLLLASGFSLEDPKTHAATIQTMIGRFLPKFWIDDALGWQ